MHRLGHQVTGLLGFVGDLVELGGVADEGTDELFHTGTARLLVTLVL